jgi:hypothetical protein
LAYNDNWAITEVGTKIKDFNPADGKAEPDRNWDNQIWKNNTVTFGEFFESTVGELELLCLDGKDVVEVNGKFKHIEPGFFAVAFYDKTINTVFVVYRGTDNKFSTDWNDYTGEDMDESNSQFIRALSFYQNTVLKALKESGKKDVNIVLCGHSLGGALADSVAMQTNLESISFNGSTGRIIPKIYSNGYYYIKAWSIFEGVDKWTFTNNITEIEEGYSLGPGTNYSIAHININSYNNNVIADNGDTFFLKYWDEGHHKIMSQIKYIDGEFVYCDPQKYNRPKTVVTFKDADWGFSIFVRFGTSYSDNIISTDDYIYGGSGNDTIKLLKGNVIREDECCIFGGKGDDTIYSYSEEILIWNPRAQEDSHYYYYKGDGFDTIEDKKGSDKIILYGFSKEDKIDIQNHDSTIRVNGEEIITLWNRKPNEEIIVEIHRTNIVAVEKITWMPVSSP